MEKETFRATVVYNGRTLEVEIQTFLPVLPDPVVYEIFVNSYYIFTITRIITKGDQQGWKLEKGIAHVGLVDIVGAAIDKHYS